MESQNNCKVKVSSRLNEYANDVEDNECAVCLQSCLQPIRLSCNHIFCFLCIKGVTINHSQTKCPMCRENISQEDLTNPNIISLGNKGLKRSRSEEKETEYKWFYSGASNGWWEYDERTTKDINKAFEIFTASEMNDSKPKKGRRKKVTKKGIDNKQKINTKDEDTQKHEMMIAGVLYVIDFVNMLQYRKNNPKKKRQIKKELKNVIVDCKGVAGVRKTEDNATKDEK